MNFGTHQALGAFVVGLGLLVAFGIAIDWGVARDGVDGHPGAWSIAVVGCAFGAVVWLLCRRLDIHYPDTTIPQAALRLLAPLIIVGFVAPPLASHGVSSDEESDALVGAGVSIGLAGLAACVIHWRVPVSGRRDDGSTGLVRVPCEDALEPPTGPPMSAPRRQQPSDEPSYGAVVSGPPPRARRVWTHRITAMLIALGWVPLGAVFVLLVNWCPPDDTSHYYWPASLVFVGLQLVANPLLGYMLDRRIGRRHGALVAVGRMVGVAILLAAISLLVFVGLAPSGESNYCG